MQRKIFFFDFDGTLYCHKNKAIPRSTLDALGALHSRGHIVVIATGRGPDAMVFIQQQLEIPCDTLILLNGQLIFHNGTKTFERFITLPSMRKIAELARQHGIAYGGYCAHGEIVDHVNDRVATVWKDFSCPLPLIVGRFEYSYPLYQGHLYMTRDESQLLLQDYLGDYITNWSHEYMVNLISRETSKSQGIRWMMKEYGIAKEDAYAFGDGFNDMDMLLSVGHGIAMGNGSDDLKRVAEYVTDAVDEEGILHALQYYQLI